MAGGSSPIVVEDSDSNFDSNFDTDADVFVVSVDSDEDVDTRLFTCRGSPLKVIKSEEFR